MQRFHQYSEKNFNESLEYLKTIVKIESISANSSKKNDMHKCANWLVEFLKYIGVEDARKYSTHGNPIVFGNLTFSKTNPTLLIYGHYDVMPPGDLSLWRTPPFDLYICDEKMYGRGVSDDKGQLLMVLLAIDAYIKIVGALPVNIKFFIEGDEERGSGYSIDFLKQNISLLKSDAVLFCENTWIDSNHPSLVSRIRGILTVIAKFKGPNRDLHSGTYGGLVTNPINAMIEVVSKIRDANGKILIPGFYDDVVELSHQEREKLSKLPFDVAKTKRELGIKDLSVAEKGHTILETNRARPSFDICGVSGGYEDEGFKTIIPSCCEIKLSWRMVPNQDPDEIFKSLKKYLLGQCPRGIEINLIKDHACVAMMADLENVYMRAMIEATEKTTGRDVAVVCIPATLPIVSVFCNEIGVPVVSMGTGLPTDYIHSPNENFEIKSFKIGMHIMVNYLDILSSCL